MMVSTQAPTITRIPKRYPHWCKRPPSAQENLSISDSEDVAKIDEKYRNVRMMTVHFLATNFLNFRVYNLMRTFTIPLHPFDMPSKLFISAI
jgi:hypothetical protein